MWLIQLILLCAVIFGLWGIGSLIVMWLAGGKEVFGPGEPKNGARAGFAMLAFTAWFIAGCPGAPTKEDWSSVGSVGPRQDRASVEGQGRQSTATPPKNLTEQRFRGNQDRKPQPSELNMERAADTTSARAPETRPRRQAMPPSVRPNKPVEIPAKLQEPMSPAPAPVRLGGNIKAPQKVRDFRPAYPPLAQSARVQGIVMIEATIGPDGAVTDTKLLRSIPLLDQTALHAVRQWLFTPTLLDGVPVPVIMTVTVQFTLQ